MSVAKGYKQTNVPWCEQIPTDWEVQPLFTRYRERWEKNWNESVTEVLSLSYGRIIPRDVSTNYGLLPESFSTYQIVYEDDIVMRPTDMQNDHVSLRVGRSHQKGIITSAYISLIPYNIDPGYAHFLLHAYDLMKIFYQIGGGVRHSLKFEDIKRLKILVPPLNEQKAIAKHLELETVQIDELIEKKKRLIELLREERAAIINQAVTRGVNPSAKLKPTGIDWLGDIPKHWEVVPMTKYFESIVDYRGRTPTKSETGIFLVTARNIKNGIIDYEASKEYILEELFESTMSRGELAVGDVLFTMEAPLGEAANVDRTNVAVAQRIVKFRALPKKLSNYFLKEWILSATFQQDLLSYATGSTALGIKSSKLFHLKLLLPPLDEQSRIVDHISQIRDRFANTISKIEAEIELIKEYRTALISEVVTGKVKVV